MQLETSADDMAEADALVALMLRRGERNATYARVLNERRGIHSPLRRFAAADMLDAFNVTLLRKTVVSPEAAAFIDLHEANSAYADYYATALPWLHYLSNNPSAPYREQDAERLYYIRYSNSVRGHGLFASEALPTGTVLGQVRDSAQISVAVYLRRMMHVSPFFVNSTRELLESQRRARCMVFSTFISLARRARPPQPRLTRRCAYPSASILTLQPRVTRCGLSMTSLRCGVIANSPG